MSHEPDDLVTLKLECTIPRQILDKYGDFWGTSGGLKKDGITTEGIAAEIMKQHPAKYGYISWEIE